jgi:hypothetical protein
MGCRALGAVFGVLVVLTTLSGPLVHLPVLHPSVTLTRGHFGLSLSNECGSGGPT